MSRRPVRRWAIQEIAIIGPKSCMKWEEKLHYKRFQKGNPIGRIELILTLNNKPKPLRLTIELKAKKEQVIN